MTMKSFIRKQVAKVNAALDRATISEEDRKIVIDTLKNAFYHWADSNAIFSVVEDFWLKTDNEMFMRVVRDAIHSGLIEEKLAKTYPFDWDEDDEEDEEDADEATDCE